ncbi:MAG: hypothetical protein M5U18_08655 [Dehalococcoidia bacterium]|nr:hypothetical protein [Dehalococcoidia bacterium]
MSANTGWRETWAAPLVFAISIVVMLSSLANAALMAAGFSLVLFATVVWALRTRPLPARVRPVMPLEAVVLAAIAAAALWLVLR